MKITKLRIRNFRGIVEMDLDVPAAGVIAKGGNAIGKSTVLRAIKSVLEGRDISADAIRIGADKAEILVDLDDLSVKRAITAKTSTLSVEKAGMKASKPTAFLKDLLGSASLDPLDLYLAKPKERRALILAALPVTITREQLKGFAPELDESFDVSGHGLEVIERARAFFYDERTAVNKEAADAQRTAERLANEAAGAAKAVTPGPLVPYEAAALAVNDAQRTVTEIQMAVRQAEASQARTATQRDQVATLRERAAEMEKTLRDPIDVADIEAERDGYVAHVKDLEAKLEAARLLVKGADERIARAMAANDAVTATTGRVADLRSQATALETALAAATIPAPSAEDVQAANAALETAKASLDRATMQAAALSAAETAEKAKQEAAAIAKEAADLDATVKRLTNDAPSKLLASADAIPGLSLSGNEVLLDGKSLDALSGAEQLKFAVEIARRANAKTKILVVDGLERLDRDQLDAFVAYATSGGWQLFGSLVTGGELVLAALETDATAAAAAE